MEDYVRLPKYIVGCNMVIDCLLILRGGILFIEQLGLTMVKN